MNAPTFAEKAFPLIMAGIPVFPCNEQKRPLTDNGFHAATTDMTTVGGWSLLYPSALVGVPTGTASGLDVVDVDVKKDEHGEIIVDGFASLEELPHGLPPTVINRTTRGEHHLYRRNGAALKSTAGKVADGIDTRGDGGYVIWWPAERGETTPPDIASLPETPAWVIAAAGDRSPAKGAASPSTGSDSIGEGSRNDTLYRLACTMQAKGFGDEAIRAAIGATNDEQCVPPLPDDEVEQIVEQALKHAKGDKQTEIIGTMAGVFPKVEQQSPEWPDPKPIVKSLLPVLPFDYQLLPEPFIAWVKDTAERKCWAPDFLAVALMAVAATLVGRKVALQPMDDDWRIVPNQWAGCVSPPGAAKSPAINLAVDFLQPFQAKAAEQFDTQMRWYENDREFHEAQVKALEAKRLALLKGDRNTEPDEQAARVVHAEIDKLKSDFKRKTPVLKRYVTRNATAEGLFDVFDQNPQGVLWHSDELSRLLKQMLTDNFSTLRGSMLSAANGNDEDTMDRRTNGRYGITVRMCLSLVGSIQSDLLPMLLASGDDGLAQRFGLFVWPDPTRADPDAARPADDAAKAKVAEALVRLDALFPMRDKDDQILIPFEASAARDFNLWRCKLLNDIEAGLIEAPFNTYLNKLPKVLGGLALIIAMVEGDTTEVTMQAWQKARKWQPYLVSHLERIVGYARNSMEHSARSIIAKLTSKAPGSNGSIVLRHEGVLYTTARECQRMGVSGCDDSRKATDLLDWLVELGYLAGPCQAGSVKKAYVINPKVGGCE